MKTTSFILALIISISIGKAQTNHQVSYFSLQDVTNNKNSGTLLTEKDGTQYFVMGKVRIKVSEHFAQDGKPLDSLLEDVIQHAAAAS